MATIVVCHNRYAFGAQSWDQCLELRLNINFLVGWFSGFKGSCQMQRFSFIISSDVQLFFKSVISLLLAVCLGLLIWEEVFTC